MRFVFSWDKAQENGTNFSGWCMDDLLTKLLVEEMARHCELHRCDDCSHNAAGAVIELMRFHQDLTWDKAQARGYCFHGWSMDRLLNHLLKEASERKCKLCHPSVVPVLGGCTHEAARHVLSLKRTVEHPLDCPDCRRIRERNRGGKNNKTWKERVMTLINKVLERLKRFFKRPEPFLSIPRDKLESPVSNVMSVYFPPSEKPQASDSSESPAQSGREPIPTGGES